METIAPLVILVLAATAIVVVLGLFSMMRGGEPDDENSPRWEPFRIHESSGELMFHRVALQAAAVVALLVAGFSVGFVTSEQGSPTPWRIEFGVVSAGAMKAAYGETSPEATAFGDIPDGSDAYLATAIVIDPETGERVDDANVWVMASPVPGLSTTEQRLEPATIAGNVTYGGYIRLPQNEPYYIDVRVEHPDAPTQRKRIEYRPTS